VAAADQLAASLGRYRARQLTAPPAASLLPLMGGVAWSGPKLNGPSKTSQGGARSSSSSYANAAQGPPAGFVSSPADGPWQWSWRIPSYEPTPDQSKAISEVKRDMEKPQPMDLAGAAMWLRQEVAIRALSRRWTAGNEAALLAPPRCWPLAARAGDALERTLRPVPNQGGLLDRFRNQQANARRSSRAQGPARLMWWWGNPQAAGQGHHLSECNSRLLR